MTRRAASAARCWCSGTTPTSAAPRMHPRAGAADGAAVRGALAAADNGIVICDARARPTARISYVNAGFTRITGYSAEEVMTATAASCRGARPILASSPRLRARSADQRQISVLLRNYLRTASRSGNKAETSRRRDEDGVCTHFIGVQNDVTERDAGGRARARLPPAVFEHQRRHHDHRRAPAPRGGQPGVHGDHRLTQRGRHRPRRR